MEVTSFNSFPPIIELDSKYETSDQEVNKALKVVKNWENATSEDITFLKICIIERNKITHLIQPKMMLLEPKNSQERKNAVTNMSIENKKDYLNTFDRLTGYLYIGQLQFPLFITLNDLILHVQIYPGENFIHDSDSIAAAINNYNEEKFLRKQEEINPLFQKINHVWNIFHQVCSMHDYFPFCSLQSENRSLNIFRGKKTSKKTELKPFFSRTERKCKVCNTYISGNWARIEFQSKQKFGNDEITFYKFFNLTQVKITQDNLHNLEFHAGLGIEPEKLASLEKLFSTISFEELSKFIKI